MEKVSLQNLFTGKEEQLKQSLSGLSIPQDNHKIQAIIYETISSLFIEDGEFRQNLTLSEDYILQAAISLLNVQQEITNLLAKDITSTPQPVLESETSLKEDLIVRPPIVLSGTLIGGTTGGLIFGTWGALIGSIVGAAIAIYGIKPLLKRIPDTAPTSIITNADSKINILDVDLFIDIVSRICAAVDELIDTVRVQMQKLKNAYEQQEAPTLHQHFSALINNLEGLFQAAESTEVDKNEEILSQIELVKRSLKNYGLVYSDGKISKK